MIFTYKARVDTNQPKIVKQIRQLGATVKTVSQVKGFCDIVVGINCKNYLLEIKDPDKPPSQRRLTPEEIKFKDSWKGQYNVVETIDDILQIINR